jgi:hypothetical protein
VAAVVEHREQDPELFSHALVIADQRLLKVPGDGPP